MSYFIPQYLLADPVAGQDVEENDEATAGRRRRRKRTKRGKHKSKAHKKRKKAKAKKRTPSTLYQHPPPAPVVAPVHRFGASEFKANPTQVRGDRAGEYYLAADGYYGGKNNPIDVDAKKKSSDDSKGKNRWSWQGKGDSGSHSGRTANKTNRFDDLSGYEAKAKTYFATAEGQAQSAKAQAAAAKAPTRDPDEIIAEKKVKKATGTLQKFIKLEAQKIRNNKEEKRQQAQYNKLIYGEEE